MPKVSDVGERVELAAELALRAGDARDAAVEAVEHRGDGDRPGRARRTRPRRPRMTAKKPRKMLPMVKALGSR